MTARYLPSTTSDTIVATIAAASAGDRIMLAPKPSFVIMQVDSTTVFRVQAGEGERLRSGDLLYVFNPSAEGAVWSLVTVSGISGDVVTASSVTGSALVAGQIAVITYNENTTITVGKALRFIAQPYCSQMFPGSANARLRGGPGPDPRVVVYGNFNFTADNSSLSGVTVLGSVDDVVVGSATAARITQVVDCIIRPKRTGATVLTFGVQYVTLLRRCRIMSGTGESLARAVRLNAATMDTCIVSDWKSDTTISGTALTESTSTIRNCSFLTNVITFSATTSRGVVMLTNSTVYNSVFYNNTLSGAAGDFAVARRVGGTCTADSIVYYNSYSGTAFPSVTATNTYEEDPKLTVNAELQDTSPNSVKNLGGYTSGYQAAIDYDRVVLDSSNRAIGARSWSAYRSAAFAWLVSQVHTGLLVVISGGGSWTLPTEDYVEWTFQSPRDFLRWAEIPIQVTIAASSVLPAASAAFDFHFGMETSGKMRARVTGTTLTGFTWSTTKNTVARWLFGRGDESAYVTDTVYNSYMLNYVPGYIACKVAFDESDLGEVQPVNLESMDMGGMVALPTAVRSYRSTLGLKITTESDEAQQALPPWLFQVNKQRFKEFFRKATGGSPIRVYLTNNNYTLGALRSGYRTADMIMLDDNRQLSLSWAETVMGRYTVDLELAEMWGF